MKKLFENPTLEIIAVSFSDVVLTSGGTDGPDGQVGDFNGWPNWGVPEE